VRGLSILNPVELETTINNIGRVVTNGLFARAARRALLGTKGGVADENPNVALFLGRQRNPRDIGPEPKKCFSAARRDISARANRRDSAGSR